MEVEVEFEMSTLNKIYSILLHLVKEIRKSGFKPDIIIGFMRCGWIPAWILSGLLEIPDLATVRVEFYLGFTETMNEPALTQGVSTGVSGKKARVIDDVANTGKSLQLAKDLLLQQGVEEGRLKTDQDT